MKEIKEMTPSEYTKHSDVSYALLATLWMLSSRMLSVLKFTRMPTFSPVSLRYIEYWHLNLPFHFQTTLLKFIDHCFFIYRLQ